MSGPAIPNGTVVMRGGKIVAVGANVQVPAGAEIVDAAGKYVMPGVIDAASHIGMEATEVHFAQIVKVPDRVHANDEDAGLAAHAIGGEDLDLDRVVQRA